MKITPPLVVAALLAVVVAGGAGARATGAPQSECATAGTKTLESSADARVFVFNHRPNALYSCLAGETKRRFLQERPSEPWYDPPAMQLVGPYLAWAIAGGTPDEFSTETDIYVTDLRLADFREFVVSRGSVRLGSVRMKSGFAVAWIECQLDPSAVDFFRAPNCPRMGHALKRVYSANPSISTRSTLLDKGRGIDTASLKLHGSQLTWLNHGKLHKATL